MYMVVNIEVAEIEQNRAHTHVFRISFNGKNIAEKSTDFNCNVARQGFIHKIENLLLEKSGRYNIDIIVDGEKIGDTYFIAK